MALRGSTGVLRTGAVCCFWAFWADIVLFFAATVLVLFARVDFLRLGEAVSSCSSTLFLAAVFTGRATVSGTADSSWRHTTSGVHSSSVVLFLVSWDGEAPLGGGRARNIGSRGARIQ